VQAHSSSHPIRPVEPLLRRYKTLLKTISRDASLRARHAADISGVLREIERWLAEARVGAALRANGSEFASSLSYRGRHAGEPVVAAVVDNGDDDEGDDEEPEPREAWALDRLCDALLVKGALVPISRKSVVSMSSSPLVPPHSNAGSTKRNTRY
jgi:ribosomal biogenesis protein LAS1